MEPFTKVWPRNITTCPDYPRCNFNRELVYCQGLIVVILSSHKHDSLIFRKSSMSKYCKVGFHRVEFCAIEENAIKRFFCACSLNKNNRCTRDFLSSGAKQNSIQLCEGFFAISQSNGLKIIIEIDLRFLRYSGKIARAYSAIAQNSTLWESTFR